jgi:Flp pilus assembly pilin Flp
MKKGARRTGQGMTEYVMLVGLVAILMVGAVKGLQVSLGGAFDKATEVIVNVGDATASGGDESSPALGKLPGRMRVNKKPPATDRAVHEETDEREPAPLPGR